MSDDAQRHRDITRREFTRQAANFERPGSLFRDRDILDWIAADVPVDAGDLVLDVAGGTGQLGRRLGRAGRLAVVVDLTPPMLAAGAAAAAEAGEHRAVFVAGDATALPFPQDQFDVVATR